MESHVYAVGDTLKVHGRTATVIKVYPFGTYDVETEDGRYFRVTGLTRYSVGERNARESKCRDCDGADPIGTLGICPACRREPVPAWN